MRDGMTDEQIKALRELLEKLLNSRNYIEDEINTLKGKLENHEKCDEAFRMSAMRNKWDEADRKLLDTALPIKKP